MAAWRQAIELALGEADVAALSAISRSRTDPANRVERARMLLAYQDKPQFFAVAQALGVHHQTVQRCVERALACGPIAALDGRPRSGREPTISAAAEGSATQEHDNQSYRGFQHCLSSGYCGSTGRSPATT